MREKYNNLINSLKEKGKICIAFSGGVDSTFLLKVAQNVLGENVLAITVRSSMYPDRELKESKEFCKSLKIKHIFLDANEYSVPEFVGNSKNRCYFCKKGIFSKVKEIAQKEGFDIVADGSNLDDEGDYRPGIKALKELGIISPLKEAGLTKNEIRELSKELGLSTWDKPSMACLASRIPYGSVITREKLKKIEIAEEFLLSNNFKQFRVRYYDDLAKIEVLKEDIPKVLQLSEVIIAKFKEIGFNYITLDLEGYRTGSMNETLR